MTFDMHRARHHADTGDLMKTTKWLYHALDEIDRQAKRIAELEEHKRDVQTIIGPCRELMSLAAHIEILLENTDYYTARRELNEVIDRSFGQQLTIIKQHAALKKLGQAKRERGKALVEERARFEYYVQNENCESWPEARRKYPELEKKYIDIAREQLRQEGKL